MRVCIFVQFQHFAYFVVFLLVHIELLTEFYGIAEVNYGNGNGNGQRSWNLWGFFIPGAFDWAHLTLYGRWILRTLAVGKYLKTFSAWGWVLGRGKMSCGLGLELDIER